VPILTLLPDWVMTELPSVDVLVNSGTVFAVPPLVVTVVCAAALAAINTQKAIFFICRRMVFNLFVLACRHLCTSTISWRYAHLYLQQHGFNLSHIGIAGHVTSKGFPSQPT